MRQVMRSVKHLLRIARRQFRVMGRRELPWRRQVKIPYVFLGSDYGGWAVSPDGLGGHSVIYSFGVGKDVTFDLAMIERFDVHVDAFDPTPESVAWVKRQSLPKQFQLHEFGLADFDGVAHFAAPPEGDVSYTLIDGGSDASDIDAPVYRLSTVMQKLGHEHIDVLKMDIEGAEFTALEDIIACKIPIKQLLVEFHYNVNKPPELDRVRTAIERLNQEGFRVFHNSVTGHEYSFIRIG